MRTILWSLVLMLVLAAPAAAQTKIAYINSATVMEQLPEAQDAQKQLDALSQQWQTELNQMANDMQKKMEDLDIPPISEFIEMIADTGAGMYACKASVDLFGMSEDDFIEQIEGIITVGEFYEIAAGGEIIFT